MTEHDQQTDDRSEWDAYDREAWEAVERWKHPPEGVIARFLKPIVKPLNEAADWALDTPVGRTISKAIIGILELLNDASAWSVAKESIFASFRAHGHSQVDRLADIQRLSLCDVDLVAKGIRRKYTAIAAAEGAAAGVVGLPGIPVDIVALVTIALRAANEYATYYGFDIDLEEERLIVMSVLSLSSAGEVGAKQVAFAELAQVMRAVAQKKPWEELQKQLIVRIVQEVAKRLGIRLTKAKLAQVLPVFGAVVGSGFNAWYINQVCTTASMIYRQRHLGRKHGCSAF